MINKQFIDVMRGPDGSLARGCAPMTEVAKTALPQYEEVYSETLRDYPRSDWDDLLVNNQSLEKQVQWTHDQKQEGTCAANAADLVYETCAAMQLGKKNVMMNSPIATYRWIAGGPNTGSGIVDNITQLQKVGTLPVDTPENRARLKAMGLNENHVLQHTGYYQKFPTGWEETAAYFQVEEAYRAITFDGCVTGLFNDFALLYGRAGHAICGLTVVKQNNVWYIKYGNSWGKWGEVGENGLQMFGYDSEAFLRNALNSYGAVLVRSIKLSDNFF